MSDTRRFRWLSCRIWLSSATLGCALLLGPTSALAGKKRAVVLDFTGPSAARVRVALVRAIKNRVRVLSEDAFINVADDLEVDDATASGKRIICGKLRCHAVVAGKVRKKRRQFIVTLTIYNAKDGTVLGRASAKARGRTKISRTGRVLARKLLRLLKRASYERGNSAAGAVGGAAGGGADDERAAGLDNTGDREDDDPSEESDEEDYAADDDDDNDDDGDEQASDDASGSDRSEATVERRSSSGPRTSLLNATVGFGLASRTYDLESSASAEPTGYRGGAYPEVTVRAEIYPLIRAVRGFARDLGLAIGYSRGIGISSKLTGQDDQEVEIESSAQELLLSLNYRFFFSDSPTSVVIQGHLGWGLRDFELGKEGADAAGNPVVNDRLTTFRYRFMRLGVSGSIPLGSPLFAIHAGVDVRPIISVGSEAVEAYGSHGGSLGWALRGGLNGRHPSGFFYLVTGEIASFSTDFDGRSDLESGQLRPGERQDATSGSDRYLRVTVGGGYTL